MSYQPEIEKQASTLRARSESLVRGRRAGLAILGGFVAFRFLQERLGTLFGGESVEFPEACYVALLLTTVWLTALWIWSSEKELDMLFNWFAPKRYVPPDDERQTLLIAAFALFLALMWYVADEPHWYTSLYWIFLWIDLLAGMKRDREVQRAVVDSRSHLAEDQQLPAKVRKVYESALSTIEHYYLRRPHLRRTVWKILFATVPAVLAWWAWRTGSVTWAGFSQLAVIGVIVGGEVVIGRWRGIRDRQLTQLVGDLWEARTLGTIGGTPTLR